MSVGGRRNFRLARIVALTYLSLRLGKLDLFATPGYTIYAIFDDISGIKTHDRVEIAGVRVGKVSALSLRDQHPQVSMQLDDGIEVDEDATAAIKTNGIIGDKYVAMTWAQRSRGYDATFVPESQALSARRFPLPVAHPPPMRDQ